MVQGGMGSLVRLCWGYCPAYSTHQRASAGFALKGLGLTTTSSSRLKVLKSVHHQLRLDMVKYYAELVQKDRFKASKFESVRDHVTILREATDEELLFFIQDAQGMTKIETREQGIQHHHPRVPNYTLRQGVLKGDLKMPSRMEHVVKLSMRKARSLLAAPGITFTVEDGPFDDDFSGFQNEVIELRELLLS